MFRKFRLLGIGIGLILIILLSSCQEMITETPVENAIETLVQQTLASNQSATTEGQENQEEPQPSLTPTLQPTPKISPTISESPDSSTNLNSNNLCNQARFIEDVTVEDRTTFDPNEPFTKIWRLENMGKCTWNSDYQIVFVSGYDLGAKHKKDLPQSIEPGETIDIHLSMYAPSSPGIYTSYWMLEDEDGNAFGVGEDAEAAFWVRIRVTEEDETIAYNFANNYCEAGWESSVSEDILCPSAENLDQGFIQKVNMPRLEDDAIYDEPAILAYPDQGEGGYMVGRYPYIEIEEGDHFRATIGCQADAQDCNVAFTLRVAQPGEGFTRLGRWHEVYEGLYYPIDIDLSQYAGEEISIVLSTITVDDSGDNYALWLDPRIIREIDKPAPTRTPQPQDLCNAATFIEDVTVEDRSVVNPSEGFVTGGGWIDSPEGAYTPDPSLSGKANFGFISKYKKGATVPTGQTEFVFHAGDLNFHSSSYEWLVVTGSDYARFKGWGSINGEEGYQFMIWAGDSPDTFRIKIWWEDGEIENVVYDNGMDQEIGGGSIVIHTN